MHRSFLNILRQQPVAILGASLMGLGVMGCDTTAELTFEDEQIIELVPQGLISASCLKNSADEQHDAVFRFSILTSFDHLMMPGERYSAIGEPLNPGKNFKASDAVFSDGWIFIVDTAATDMTCTGDGDCPSGSSCLSAQDMGLSQYYYDRTLKFCVFPTTIHTVTEPKFTHFNTVQVESENVVSQKMQGRTVAFMIDNSASLDGSQKTGIPDQDQATDPWQYRKVGLNQYMDGLAVTTESAPKFEFSAHFANGSDKNGVFDISPHWMRTPAVWNATVMEKYPTPGGASPVWETACAAMQKIQDSANAGYTHTMIGLTDGAPNEGTDEAYTEFQRLVQVSPDTDLHWIDFEPKTQPPHRRYAEMTGLTCGSYYLLNTDSQIPWAMRNLAINSESHWDIGISFSAMLPKNYSYRLATDIVVKLGKSAVAFNAQRMTNEQNEAMDYRLVFTK